MAAFQIIDLFNLTNTFIFVLANGFILDHGVFYYGIALQIISLLILDYNRGTQQSPSIFQGSVEFMPYCHK